MLEWWRQLDMRGHCTNLFVHNKSIFASETNTVCSGNVSQLEWNSFALMKWVHLSPWPHHLHSQIPILLRNCMYTQTEYSFAEIGSWDTGGERELNCHDNCGLCELQCCGVGGNSYHGNVVSIAPEGSLSLNDGSEILGHLLPMVHWIGHQVPYCGLGCGVSYVKLCYLQLHCTLNEHHCDHSSLYSH